MRAVVTAIGTAVLLGGMGQPNPLYAQTGGWQAMSSETACNGVTKKLSNGGELSLTKNHEISVKLPVGAVSQPESSIFNRLDFKARSNYSHYTGVYYSRRENSANGKASYVANFTASGDAGFLDWVVKNEPIYDLHNDGKYLTTFDTFWVAEARQAMKTCKPLAAPAGRKVSLNGAPAQWFTANDYEAFMGDKNSIGPFAAKLDIGIDGRVTRCTITTSSGVPAADTKFCTDLTRKGRFKAATDAQGKLIPGTFDFRIAPLTLY